MRLKPFLARFFEHRWGFLRGFLAVFFFTFLLLSLLGIEPRETELVSALPEAPGRSEVPASISEVAEPVRVLIPKIGVDMSIVNPQSRDTLVLDRALQEGVVHYPGSGFLGEDANVFLFGHSSYLPVVQNPAYRAFNNLGKLEVGDEITVESAAYAYHYRVTSVRRASAEEALVSLERGERKLTLSTCDSFGEASDRYVVEAEPAA